MSLSQSDVHIYGFVTAVASEFYLEIKNQNSIPRTKRPIQDITLGQEVLKCVFKDTISRRLGFM